MSQWLVLEGRPDLACLIGVQGNWFFAENMFVHCGACDHRVKVERIGCGHDDAVDFGMLDGGLPIACDQVCLILLLCGF